MDKNSCSCRDVELLISKSVDGECSASDREKLHAHLSLCSECRSVQSDFERIQSLLERTVSADLVVPPPLPDVSHLADDARTKGSRSAVFWRQAGQSPESLRAIEKPPQPHWQEGALVSTH